MLSLAKGDHPAPSLSTSSRISLLNSLQCQPYPYLGKCQGCRILGYSVPDLPTGRSPSNSPAWSSLAPHNHQWHPMAHVSTSPSLISPNWFLESGASHHVTVDLNNLTFHAPYDGPNDIIISDGNGLHITHSGLTSLSTTSHSFTSLNVLCVPTMKRNHIFISQFFKSNQTYVEFLPFSFHVKDLQTGAILLHGLTKDDVYEWQTKPSTSIIMFFSVKASPSDWHHQLDHSSMHILWNLVSKYKLHSVSVWLPSFHCNDCLCNKIHKLPFSHSTIVSSAPLQIIFSDVWTSPILSTDNFKY